MGELRVVVDGEAWRWPRTGVGRFAYGLGRALLRCAEEDLAVQVWAEGRLWPLSEAVARFARPRWRDEAMRWLRLAARRFGGGAVRRAWRVWQERRWQSVERAGAVGAVGEREGTGQSPGGALRAGGAGARVGGAAVADVWFAPNFVPSVWGGARRLVVTVHDLSCFDHPEWHPAERVAFMAREMPRALAEAAVVTVVSEATRARLLAAFPLPPERVVVTYPGLDEAFTPTPLEAAQGWLRRWGLRPGGYFLCVGTLEPRKNWPTVLRAYAALPSALREAMPLAVVGMKGWHTEALEREAAPLVRAGCVRFLGFVPDEGLAALYSHTAGFFYLSFYEGFGLPPLEAMGCGAPVVASNTTSLPEVLGDAGVLLPPEDVAAVAEAMRRLAEDGAWRKALSERGLARAQRFSWAACALATVGALRLAAA